MELTLGGRTDKRGHINGFEIWGACRMAWNLGKITVWETDLWNTLEEMWRARLWTAVAKGGRGGLAVEWSAASDRSFEHDLCILSLCQPTVYWAAWSLLGLFLWVLEAFEDSGSGLGKSDLSGILTNRFFFFFLFLLKCYFFGG